MVWVSPLVAGAVLDWAMNVWCGLDGRAGALVVCRRFLGEPTMKVVLLSRA